MDVTHPSTPGAGPAGRSFGEISAVVDDAITALGQLRSCTLTATGADLTRLLASLGELALRVDAAEVAVVADAIERGVHREGTFPLPAAGWIIDTSRRYSSGLGAGRVARLAEAMLPVGPTRKAGILAAGQDGQVLGDAVLSARVPVACADVAVTEMKRLIPDLVPEKIPNAWDAFTEVGAWGDVKKVRQVRHATYAKYGRPDRHEKDETTARAKESLSCGTTDPDGMTSYRLQLGPEAVATLEAALSKLTKPRPGADGEADERSYSTRRAHALMEIVQRAARSTDVVGRPASQLSIIIPLRDLNEEGGCAATMAVPGAGSFLAAATARRHACGAEITPVIIDDAGNPIIIGRSRRLFLPAQVKAMVIRDERCTFPRCTMPAGWSEAHHLVHWLDDGETEISNGALLCNFHHHVVHSRRLHGWITTDPPDPPQGAGPDSAGPDSADTACAGPDSADPDSADPAQLARRSGPPGRARVVWDLSPGSYDRHLATRMRPGA